MPLPDSPLWPHHPPKWREIEETVARLLHDGSWAKYSGEENERLTAQLADRWGCQHVRLCSSGTAALELALRAARLGDGQEVLLCAYDFPGNLRTVEQVGARPALVDCRADDWTIDPEQLMAAAGPQTRAVIVSHLYGSIAPMDHLRDWADRRQIVLIEDACQTPGGALQERPLGAWGDVGILSFGGSKPLTAGCGGALLTNDARLAQRAAAIAERPSDAFPLSPIQAALLLPQLQRLDEWASLRRRAAYQFMAATAEILAANGGTNGSPGWRAPIGKEKGRQRDFYKLPWLAADTALRNRAITACQAAGLPVGEGYRSAGRMSPRRCRISAPVPHADRAAAGTLVLDHRVLYADDETRHRIAEKLAACLAAAAP